MPTVTAASTGNASLLLDLPPEVVHGIMTNLTPEALAALRLTCSSLAKLGIEHLLDEIHLVYNLDRFQRLDKISAHPVVSKRVKSLYYQADRLEPFPDSETWNEERCKYHCEHERAVRDKAVHPERHLEELRDGITLFKLKGWKTEAGVTGDFFGI